ncbi:MAG: 6-carboxytetrahydropterin synthase [Ferruginibacter sp.]|nr:6-carboxytetrahydropterin synthase [Ferruginibacter sp.]
MNRVSVFRKEHFNAAHRLHNDTWSEEKNIAIFGKCNNPYFHGHNYDLTVQVIGVPDAETGYVIDTKILSDIIIENVINKFDHKNLNEDCAEFKTINPTAENIVIVIYNILRPLIQSSLQLKLRLYETERNFVEYPV